MNAILETINEKLNLGLEKYDDEIITIEVLLSVVFLSLAISEYGKLLNRKKGD